MGLINPAEGALRRRGAKPERMPSAGDLYRMQAAGCRHGASQSPFYAALLDVLAVDADAGGPAARVLEPVVSLGFDAASPLRLLGGVHRAVLSGLVPELAARFASVGGDGDPSAAVAPLLALLTDPPAVVTDALRWDPQTNEVGRAAALAVGLAVVARETGLPLHLLEIGASGGLNLRLDRFWYSTSGASWGDPESPVRFTDSDYEGSPPFVPEMSITERRGCDLNPIDASSEDGMLTLLSYVWPDQRERLVRLRAALHIAREVPVVLDRSPADDWVAEHLVSRPGVATVLFHSIMWQYLPGAVQQRITQLVEMRARSATRDAPIAWLRFEPSPDWTHPETRLRIWPRLPVDRLPEDRLVATSSYHGPPVRVFS